MKPLIFLTSIILFLLSFTIQAQELTTKNGFWGPKYYLDDDRISKGQIETILLNDKEANKIWQKSITHYRIANVTSAISTGLLVMNLVTAIRNEDDRSNPNYHHGFGVGYLALIGTSAGFTISSNKLRKEAVSMYNQNQNGISSIKLGPTWNGIGVVFSF